MLVTDAGMATLANALHLRKAHASMLVTDAGMATLANEMHARKAHASILVTDVGMSTLANELHVAKANLPMLVMDVGIVTLVTSFLSTPHSSHESCPSPEIGFGCVMLAVPSGMAKCTPPPDDGAAAAAIFGGVLGAPRKKRSRCLRCLFVRCLSHHFLISSGRRITQPLLLATPSF